MRQRPFPQLSVRPGPLLGASFSRDTGPFDFSPAVPPARQARCHCHTDPGGDPQVAGDLTDHITAGEPLGGLQPQPLPPLLPGGRVPAPREMLDDRQNRGSRSVRSTASAAIPPDQSP
jgi:hypothetical protein